MDIPPDRAVPGNRPIRSSHRAGPLRHDADVLFHAHRKGRPGHGRQDEAVHHVLYARRPQRVEAARGDLSRAGRASDSGDGRRVLQPRAGSRAGMKKVRLITDGSCLGNPGPGGWACILRYGKHKREIYGYAPQTTNNRMELTAAIEGLRTLKERCQVEIVTDSEYVKNGITTWIHGWKRKNWMTSSKKPVVNRDLWEELDRLAAEHHVEW